MMEKVLTKYGSDKAILLRFEAVATLLNVNALEKGTGSTFTVEDTWRDIGQEWKWTTIIRNNLDEWCRTQILTPAQWDMIANGEGSPAEIVLKAYNEIVKGKYFKE